MGHALLFVIQAWLVGILFSSCKTYDAPNVVVNPSLEFTSADGTPSSWRLYTPHGKVQWEQSATDFYHGSKSGYFKILDYDKTSNLLSVGVIAGDSDGYTGQNAYVLEHPKHYRFSFYARGNLQDLQVQLLTWMSDTAELESRRYLSSDQKIVLTDTWQRYEMEFATDKYVKRAVPMFYVLKRGLSTVPVEEVYFDNVMLQTDPETLFERYRKLMFSIRNRILRID